jgi:hypothetical protein
MEIAPELLNNCFVVAPRSIARRMEATLGELLDLAQTHAAELHSQLACALLNEIVDVWRKTRRFRFSGSLRWLTTMAVSLVKVRLFVLFSNTDPLFPERLSQSLHR